MICPKCGQEYEGDKCPRCSGPEIIVNNADYLKRRKAYEEKQALDGSASSDKQPEKEELLPDEILRRITQGGSKAAADAAAKTADRAKRVVKGKKKHIKRIIAVIVVLIFAAAAGFGIYKLAARKNYILYMSYNDKIYNVAGLDSELVCSVGDAVFEVGKDTFYTPSFPSDFNKDNVLQSAASPDGKYFAAVVYDEERGKYSLFVWNGSSCVRLAESSREKEIIYVSEKGTVIYKDTELINNQGSLGETSLMVSRLEKGDNDELHGVITELEANLSSVYVYSGKNTVIFNSLNDELYTFNYEKDAQKKLISDGAKNIYALKESSDGHYSYSASVVNSSDNADGFIYSVDNVCYYHSITSKNGKDVYIGQFSGSGIEFIYEKDTAYAVNSGQVSFASLKKDTQPEFKQVVKLSSSSNIVYLSDGSIAAVDEDNRLVSISEGKLKVLAEGIADGSLNQVKNTEQGVTYIRDGVQYYRKNLSASEVKMTDAGGSTDTSSTLYYKNRLYFYNSQGSLCSCTVKGRDGSIVGEVERFWLGTEYK